MPRGGGGLFGLGAALQWTSCCFLGQQTLAQRARRPWLARVARRRTCAEGTTRPPAKPGLLLASVSTDASALFFFCVFLRFFFFFVGASESLPEPLALDWAAILPFCSGGLPSTRPRRGATQANRMPAPGPDSAAYFFWDRARMRRLSTFLSILRVDLSPGDRSEACSRAGQPAKTLSISQFRVTIQVHFYTQDQDCPKQCSHEA